MALCLQHYASEQTVMISNGCSAILVSGTFASSPAVWSGVGLPSMEVVPGRKHESGKDNSLSHSLLAQGLQALSWSDYFLCYTRLIWSWSKRSVGTMCLGITVF